ncbi:hypothetical protein TCAL_11374 [Tigriopus californicus]|uniref:Methyltransferase domain-containing protein n=1 Tax=Tigriopus californicus TaxID=6832 RepID=A0A553NXW7_TIGCA|nr:methyltransferase-like 26 [Tigriopus californicus]TRY70266.1 hypothetical protein TCAL_11374 [Tigriopus californicus]|eukprot:TCALIF_11374-PA protein Name:"Similar to CG18661 UPF0585 protein CG18661 (Drosophila melanogaster)" AED:0.04 eAED:0.04 QI:0/-1/0/1/-1/1/1/0/227
MALNASLSPETLHSPAALRNREPIALTLAPYLDQIQAATPKSHPTDPDRAMAVRGRLLEVASGGGTHVAYLARRYPQLDWQPTEREPELVRRIENLLVTEALSNVGVPCELDITQVPSDWPAQSFDGLLNLNMVHISPWTATLGLMEAAQRLLKPGGRLFLYGPFAENGRLTPESNRRFHATLRQQNATWGIRDIRDLEEEAAKVGLGLEAHHAMPANNRILVFKKM